MNIQIKIGDFRTSSFMDSIHIPKSKESDGFEEQYYSPEMLEMKSDINEKTDIW